MENGVWLKLKIVLYLFNVIQLNKVGITLIVFSVLIIVALYVLYCFNYIPVSYTHLDVYKRQAQTRP